MVLNSTETILYLFARAELCACVLWYSRELSCIYLSGVALGAHVFRIVGELGARPARSFAFRHRCRFKAAFDSFLIFGRGTHERVLCTLLFLPLMHATSLIYILIDMAFTTSFSFGTNKLITFKGLNDSSYCHQSSHALLTYLMLTI